MALVHAIFRQWVEAVVVAVAMAGISLSGKARFYFK